MVWQESALLRLAERQAGREEELAQAHQRASQAEARADDLDQDVALLQQQVAALKEVSLLPSCTTPPFRPHGHSENHEDKQPHSVCPLEQHRVVLKFAAFQ